MFCNRIAKLPTKPLYSLFETSNIDSILDGLACRTNVGVVPVVVYLDF